MSDAHTKLNALALEAARSALMRCCGARPWVEKMLARRPFPSTHALLEAADEVWATLDREAYREAFAAHPRIGEDLHTLRSKFGSTASWANQEQAGTASADAQTLLALRDENEAYFARFGFIFIVCASGKSAGEMLELMRARMYNPPLLELEVAAGEQAKITKLRLQKLT
ncbi:MAG: 2-oxo-4-hydroxy-4-carboxy--5-ureidoimidazoline decarboxylase [Myxococcaceae bacterium]|nr:2-oxo-4-hydroxy-4-carboxy--5-ureidoimidazoline decarboxylase [Myxococcaceae bacterium]